MKIKFSYSKKVRRGRGEDYIDLSFLVAGPAGPSLPAWQRRRQSCLAELQHAPSAHTTDSHRLSKPVVFFSHQALR